MSLKQRTSHLLGRDTIIPGYETMEKLVLCSSWRRHSRDQGTVTSVLCSRPRAMHCRGLFSAPSCVCVCVAAALHSAEFSPADLWREHTSCLWEGRRGQCWRGGMLNHVDTGGSPTQTAPMLTPSPPLRQCPTHPHLGGIWPPPLSFSNLIDTS